jgi:hypothetical protein
LGDPWWSFRRDDGHAFRRDAGQVHNDLAKVMHAAAQAPQSSIVVYGVRSEQAEQAAVATGHPQTLHLRHLSQSHETMKACAVDGAILVGGKLRFANGKEAEVFGQIAK